jgi:hypothetical protein
MFALRPGQIRLRTILIAAALLPPLIGAMAGVFGEPVQVWILTLIFAPLIILSMAGFAFLLGYSLLALPLSLLGRAIDLIVDRWNAGKGRF